MSLGGLGLLGLGLGLGWGWGLVGSVTSVVVGSRLRGSIPVEGFGRLRMVLLLILMVLVVFGLGLVMVVVMVREGVVLIRGVIWRCGAEAGCTLVVRCPRLQFRRLGGC